MIAPFVLLLAFAVQPLVDETIEVGPGTQSRIGVTSRQSAAVVRCQFEVESGRTGVMVALVPVPRPPTGLRPPLVATDYQREGSFRVDAPAGDYWLLIDNQLEGRSPVRVHITVSLEPLPHGLRAQTLSTTRRIIVIAVSLALFAAIVLYAGQKLRHALHNRAMGRDGNSTL